MAKKPLIGFIGQGWIGKNYADNFEKRGYKTVRYALEEPYRNNKEKLKDCDLVFIAVPTPTTSKGFDYSIVSNALGFLKAGQIAVIKSTIIPGTALKLQKKYPKLIMVYSPEFLSELTATYDAAHPFMNIMGIAGKGKKHEQASKLVHSVLPKAPFALTCSSTEAEIIKYTHNASGYTQIIFFNLMYDLARSLGADWGPVHQAIKADPLICSRYAQPIHKSGRGAGGNCFIKDFAALRGLYIKSMPKDKAGKAILDALEEKNISLLNSTNKDMSILEGVYGKRKKG